MREWITEIKEVTSTENLENLRQQVAGGAICKHEIVSGDHYGQTCDICGKIMQGYGKGGTSQVCKHFFLPVKEENHLSCIYCECIILNEPF